MEYDLSPEQQLLKESIERFAAGQYDFEQRRRTLATPEGWSRSAWADLMALGIGRMPFTEQRGGLGLGGVELMIVAEAFGRALVIEPYLPSIVLAGTAIAAAEQTTGAQAALERIMDGETIAALAIAAAVDVVRTDNGWRLDGVAAQVIGADCAEFLVVPAGDALFLLPADKPGLSRRSYRMHGGGGAADIRFAAVEADASMRLQCGDAIERAVDFGLCFLAGEAVGAMTGALDLTVEHLKTRVQFGAPLGANQALQHRAAEMLVELEQARSAAMYAAVLLEERDAHERARGLAAVKAVVSKSGRFVAQTAVQLHGGIGVSEEHIVSHYFRRLTAINLLLGGADEHVARLAALGGFTSAEDHLGPSA